MSSPTCSPTDESRVVDLLGTAFAVTHRHVVTAFHNLLDSDEDWNSMPGSMFDICRQVIKKADKQCFETPITVKYVLGDPTLDWAILEIVDVALKFSGFIPLCPISDLPKPLVSEREELKTYYAPIGQYLTNSFHSCQIWCDRYKPVLQYDRNNEVICLDGGLYRGSCGAPYVDHGGRVVAMHLSSMHEGKEFSHTKKKQKTQKATIASLSARVDVLSEASTDMQDVHNSIRQGLVLARISELVDFLSQYIS